MAFRARLARLAVAAVLVALLGPSLAGKPAAAAGAVPSADQADEALRFHQLITGLSPGPAPGEMVLTFNDGSGVLLDAGQELLRVPAGSGSLEPIQWIPDSGWLLLPGTAPQEVETTSGRSATALPACATALGVQALDSAVAWLCGGTLEILPLPSHGAPSVAAAATYTLGRLPGSVVMFSVDPTGSSVAVQVGDTVYFYTLSDPGAPQSDMFNRGVQPDLVEMRWLSADVLALADPAGVFFWDASFGGLIQQLWTGAANAQAIHVWDYGAGAWVLNVANPGSRVPSYALDRFDTDGTYGTVAEGRLGYIVGMSKGGSLLWREEGVGATVYTTSTADPGPGPFWLQAVPLPQTVPLHRIPLPLLGSLHMVSPEVGWAVTLPGQSGGGQVIWTADGGSTWRGGIPQNWPAGAAPGQTALSAVFARPGGCASITCYAGWAYAATRPAQLSGTTDGGLHWHLLAENLVGGSFWRAPALLSFPTTQDGWMLLFPCCRARGEVLAYGSRDGGSSWTRLPAIHWRVPSNRVPQKFAMTAGGQGWITGTAALRPWVDTTDDGGATWVMRGLTAPAGLAGPVVEGAVVASTAERLTLPVVFGAGASRTVVLYQSTDGGRTWTFTRPVPAAPSLSLPWDVRSASDAWVVGASGLAVTTDGGRTWSAAGPGLDLGAMADGNVAIPNAFVLADFEVDGRVSSQVQNQIAGPVPPGVEALSFVSRRAGFLAQTAQTSGGQYDTRLLRTKDGGARWAAVPAVLVCQANC